MPHSINDTQHYNAMHYTECRFAEYYFLYIVMLCHDAEWYSAKCHYVERHYAECRGANFLALLKCANQFNLLLLLLLAWTAESPQNVYTNSTEHIRTPMQENNSLKLPQMSN
jgi:hypothetical protein